MLHDLGTIRSLVWTFDASPHTEVSRTRIEKIVANVFLTSLMQISESKGFALGRHYK